MLLWSCPTLQLPKSQELRLCNVDMFRPELQHIIDEEARQWHSHMLPAAVQLAAGGAVRRAWGRTQPVR